MQQAGWHTDPTGRHEHRYWDGAVWTDQVADGGVAASDPVAQVPGLDQAITQASDALRAALETQVTTEHPRHEMSAAVAVAAQTLTLLCLGDPTSIGISFPDDEGARLAAAAVFHRDAASLRQEGLASAVRVLAFHPLLVWTGAPGVVEDCAGPLGVAPEQWAVGAELANRYIAAAGGSEAENALLGRLFARCPERGWDETYFTEIQDHLRTQLLPAGAPPAGNDELALLWAGLDTIIEVFAALFPGLGPSGLAKP